MTDFGLFVLGFMAGKFAVDMVEVAVDSWLLWKAWRQWLEKTRGKRRKR